MTHDRYITREALLSQAATYLASEHHFNASHTPGPNDDAEMEYNEERLLLAARAFVEAHKDVKTAHEIYMESYKR